MKKILFPLLLLSITLLNAQENTPETKEEVAFAIIEHVPVYPGCDENMGNQALKECMSSQISNIISKNFNVGLANSLNLPVGKVRIIVMFKIDTNGTVFDIKVRAPHPELKKEAIRVIQLIPKMDKPGFQKGEPVVVPYALPIVFVVEDNAPLSKKERRKLKKQNKSI